MSTPDMSAFGKYIPGFDFLQNLSRQAAGTLTPGTQSGVSGMPPLSQWVAPTFSVEDLEKRIQELRAVQFWLDQNAKALGATVQALEVQKMTLSALRGMNVKLQDVAEAFKVRTPAAEAAPAPQPAPAPAARAEQPASDTADAGAEADKPNVDPMQWWGALTQQFQSIASGAIKDMASHAAKTAEQMAQTVQATAQAAAKPAAPKAAAAAKPDGAAKPRRAGAAAGASSKTGKAAGARSAAAAAPRAAADRSRKPAAR